MAEVIREWQYKNVYGSVTPQHLMLTAHDKEWGAWYNPHIHCKPTLKWVEDLKAIQELVLSGNDHVFFWSDSAPHPIDSKESSCCSAGAFSSPVAIETITDWFFREETIKQGLDKGFLPKKAYLHNLQEKLQAFLWNNANKVYWKPLFEKRITLERKPFSVPEYYDRNPVYWEQWSPKIVPINHWEELQ